LKRWQKCFLQTISRPFLRLSGPKLQSLRFQYEKAGLTVADEPIPWNAETVVIEASIWFPPGTVPRKSEFQLRTPDRVPRMPVTLAPAGEGDTVRVVFRLPPIQAQTLAVVQYQGAPLGQIALPFLAANTFLCNVQLRATSVFALLGKQNVACQTFVAGQCRGLSAGGVLTSPTSLLPIIDLDFRIEVSDEGKTRMESISLPLTASQLQGKETALSVVLPIWARVMGTCSTRWILADRSLAHAQVRAISLAELPQSLYLVESHFLSQAKEGTGHFRHHLRAPDQVKGLRPCFLIASREPGMAGLCHFEIRMQPRDPSSRPLVCKQEMLVTDRPLPCIPDLTTVADLQQVRAFELFCNGQPLGALPVRPTPVAAFTSEGGFRAAMDFDWSPSTDEELFERLEKLMETNREEQRPYSPAPLSGRNARDLALASAMAAWNSPPGTGTLRTPPEGGSS
jgi:hypothetical protein